MDKAKLEEFRQLLQEQMDQLLREADKTVSEMTDEKTNFPEGFTPDQHRATGNPVHILCINELSMIFLIASNMLKLPILVD